MKKKKKSEESQNWTRLQLSPIWLSEEFLNPIISKLDEHVVLLLINYIASQLLLSQAIILKQRQTKIL